MERSEVAYLLGELTIEEFDELIEGYIERGGPDAVSFTAFGEVLADLEAESAQETIELTGVAQGGTIVFDHWDDQSSGGGRERDDA